MFRVSSYVIDNAIFLVIQGACPIDMASNQKQSEFSCFDQFL